MVLLWSISLGIIWILPKTVLQISHSGYRKAEFSVIQLRTWFISVTTSELETVITPAICEDLSVLFILQVWSRLPLWWEVVSSCTHITTKIVSTYHRWCLATTLWLDILMNTLEKSCQITSHPCKEILQIHSTLTVFPVTVLLQNWQLGNMVSAISSATPYVRTLLELTITTDKCLQSLTCTGSWVHRESLCMNSYRL